MSLDLAQCQRFSMGINYAYRRFAQDFGGIAQWNVLPLHQDTTAQDEWRTELCALKADCFDYARVWMLQELWTSDINWNATDPNCADSLNGNIALDISKLLEIAAECDIEIQFTLFSFDGFKVRGGACPDSGHEDLNLSSYRSLYDVFTSGCLQELCDNVIVPLVTAAANDPNASHIHSWDVFNEPDQVTNNDITPLALAGQYAGTGAIFQTEGQGFVGVKGPPCFDTLNINQMRVLIQTIIACTKGAADCPVTVGVNAKWGYAFAGLGQDFHSLHTYNWGEPFFPTRENPPSWFINDGLPAQMGEYPPGCNSGAAMANSTPEGDLCAYAEQGWFSAAGWSVTDDGFGFSGCRARMAAFMESEVKVIKEVQIEPAVIPCEGTGGEVVMRLLNGCGQQFHAATASNLATLPNSDGWRPRVRQGECEYYTNVTPDASCVEQTVSVDVPVFPAWGGVTLTSNDVEYTTDPVVDDCDTVELCFDTEPPTDCRTVELCFDTSQDPFELPGAENGYGCFTVKTCHQVLCGTQSECNTNCSVCCDPHESGLLWCDLCTCKCWNVTGSDENSLDGSSILNTCGCAPNKRWRFRGGPLHNWVVSDTTSGVKKPFRCLVIWDHDLHRFGGSAIQVHADGVPLQPYNYQSTTVPVLPRIEHDGTECAEPIIFCIEKEIDVARLELFILTPRDDVDYSIGSISALQFMKFPHGLQPGFVNPYTSGDYSITFKNGACGKLTQTEEHEDKEVQVSTAGVDECWVREQFRPIERYQRSGGQVYFAWSMNRYPNEVMRGTISDATATHSTRTKSGVSFTFTGQTELEK